MLFSMKVSGFTFIRNAITYDYPIVEAIQSILPLCDEVVVAVGQSDDDTRALIQRIDDARIRIIDTIWDDSLRSGGKVLAVETDKALAAIDPSADWAFYIQGDEVLHEKYIEPILTAMQSYKDVNDVDALLFDYLHFYGSYDYVGNSSRWYRHEIRCIKPGRGVYSYQDAQGFRKGNNQKLIAAPSNAAIYHYGWVKDLIAMQAKHESFNKLWHDDDWVADNVLPAEEFDYNSKVRVLKRFEGTHPDVMLDRIARQNWSFSYDISKSKPTLKDTFKQLMLRAFGVDLYYNNFIRYRR